MQFEDLLKKVGHLACFSTRFLAAGEKLAQVRLQLNRWAKVGKIIRVHKGLYVLAEPYRKVKVELFTVANTLKSPSYVSMQSALSFYGMIPEFVPAVTSVTTARPQTIETPVGRFEYRHIIKEFLWGYKRIELSQNIYAFVATPEKALLDLVYLTDGGNRMEFLEELRLQNLTMLSRDILMHYAEKSGSPKLKRAELIIERIIDQSKGIEL